MVILRMTVRQPFGYNHSDKVVGGRMTDIKSGVIFHTDDNQVR